MQSIYILPFDDKRVAITAADPESMKFEKIIGLLNYNSPELEKTLSEYYHNDCSLKIAGEAMTILQKETMWFKPFLELDRNTSSELKKPSRIMEVYTAPYHKDHLRPVFLADLASNYNPADRFFPRFINQANPMIKSYLCEDLLEIKWDLIESYCVAYLDSTRYQEDQSIWFLAKCGPDVLLLQAKTSQQKRKQKLLPHQETNLIGFSRLRFHTMFNPSAITWIQDFCKLSPFSRTVEVKDEFRSIENQARRAGFNEHSVASAILGCMYWKQSKGKLYRSSLWYYCQLVAEGSDLIKTALSADSASSRENFYYPIVILLNLMSEHPAPIDMMNLFVAHRFDSETMSFGRMSVMCNSIYPPIALLQLLKSTTRSWRGLKNPQSRNLFVDWFAGTAYDEPQRMHQLEELLDIVYTRGSSHELMSKLASHLVATEDENNLPGFMLVENIQKLCARCQDITSTRIRGPSFFWDRTIDEVFFKGVRLIGATNQFASNLEAIKLRAQTELSMPSENHKPIITFQMTEHGIKHSVHLSHAPMDKCESCGKQEHMYYFRTITRLDEMIAPILTWETGKSAEEESPVVLLGRNFQTLAHELVHRNEIDSGLIINQPQGYPRYVLHDENTEPKAIRLPNGISDSIQINSLPTMVCRILAEEQIPKYEPSTNSFMAEMESDEKERHPKRLEVFETPTNTAVAYDFKELLDVFASKPNMNQ